MNKYQPIFEQLLPGAPYELENLTDFEGVLTLTLSGADDRRLTLRFDSYLVYRKMAEGDALLTLSAIKRTGGLAKWFYKVDDSDLVAWFKRERCDDRPQQILEHYVIAALNDVVDIVALCAPDIEVDQAM